jgi:hypothetical protein
LAPPAAGKTSEQTRKRATRDYARGHGAPAHSAATLKRSKASEKALERESAAAASPRALSRQAHAAARARSPGERSAAAVRAAKTKGSRADRAQP